MEPRRNTLTSPYIEGRPDKNLEAGPEAEVMEDPAYQLAPHGLLSLSSYTGQDHLPRSDTALSELGPLPHQSRHCPTGQTGGGSSSAEILSSQVTLFVSIR